MSEKKEEKKEKCFVIMPISDQGDYPSGHFTKVYEQIIKPAVEDTGYEAYRVDENNICDSIINKIFSAIQECPMAICDLSNRNPNVLYELGLRQAYDKPVVLIQDDKTQKIFDVSGISTVFYKSTRVYEDVMEARENIKKAILSTKEGKISTLAKVIKVGTADFSKVEVSQDDMTNVMLERIFNEIRELKNKKETEYLPSVVTNPRNSVRLPNNKPNATVHETVMFRCSSPQTFDQFTDKLIRNVDGIRGAEPERISKIRWLIHFGFSPKISIDAAFKVIYQIATEFGIEYSEANDF